MSIFVQGQKVNALYLNNNRAVRVGESGCTEIIVVMENGQMSGVPWFEVYKGDVIESKWNAATIIGVET